MGAPGQVGEQVGLDIFRDGVWNGSFVEVASSSCVLTPCTGIVEGVCSSRNAFSPPVIVNRIATVTLRDFLRSQDYKSILEDLVQEEGTSVGGSA